MTEQDINEEPATPGAQRQIDALRDRMHAALRAMLVAGVLFTLGFVLTGWQVKRAFDNQEAERISRIGGQSSINAYFCRKIDQVGNGVAALVAVSLRTSLPREALTPAQQEGYDQFQKYLNQQRRPPRCRQVALQLAVLTGANPADVVITPLRLHHQTDHRGG